MIKTFELERKIKSYTLSPRFNVEAILGIFDLMPETYNPTDKEGDDKSISNFIELFLPDLICTNGISQHVLHVKKIQSFNLSHSSK